MLTDHVKTLQQLCFIYGYSINEFKVMTKYISVEQSAHPHLTAIVTFSGRQNMLSISLSTD